MLAACTAEGETIIHGAAREPEIVNLQGFLNAAGVACSGAGTETVRIGGMSERGRVGWRIAPDRIVASTLPAPPQPPAGT